jgi:hypothetical protein
MNVEIGTEAAQFPEKDDINEIFVALQINVAFFVGAFGFLCSSLAIYSNCFILRFFYFTG